MVFGRERSVYRLINIYEKLVTLFLEVRLIYEKEITYFSGKIPNE